MQLPTAKPKGQRTTGMLDWYLRDRSEQIEAAIRSTKALAAPVPIVTRQDIWAFKKAQGDTHVNLTLDRGGLATLDNVLDVAEEALRSGSGIIGVLLMCMGDGNDPGEPDNDPGALGYSWLMANFDAIVARVKARGLLPYFIFCPGYDGVVPAWQPWSRVNAFARMARAVLTKYGGGYLAIEMAAGYGHSWSGENDDFGTDDGKCFDLILNEGPIAMGPPDHPAPVDFCNQSNDVRAPFDQIWQIAKRMLGPLFKRPAAMPACDDPGLYGGGPSVHVTPRGRFFINWFEYDTYEYIRLGRLSDADVARHRANFHALGYQWVC